MMIDHYCNLKLIFLVAHAPDFNASKIVVLG